MKISQAWIAFASEHRLEQHDTEMVEKDTQQMALDRRRSRPGNRRLLSTVVVDRISLSHQEKKEVQSNYSAGMNAQSSVRSIENGDVIEHEQTHAMEKIVGGIIDKEVTILKISRNEDVRISNVPDIESETPQSSELQEGPAGRPARTGLFSESVRASQLSISSTRIHFEQESTQFSSNGQVTTEDGRVIDFNLDMSLERSFLSRTEEKTLIHRWQEQINLTDPLVISLDGNMPTLSNALFEFDLDSDGKKDLINFTAAGSGFLALDRNEDSIINNGSELFGPGTGNGFNELAAFDDDNNRWIDENDAVFAKLKVWTKNKEGQDQLISLKDAGIGAIALDHADTLFNMTDADNRLNGQMKQSGLFLFEDGKVGSVHQVDLVSHEPVVPNIEVKPEPEPEENIINPGQMILPSTPEAASAVDKTAVNPLQELLDRIEELKERLTAFMEKMNSEQEGRRMKRDRHRSYDYFRPDPSVLISGRSRGVRSHRWQA